MNALNKVYSTLTKLLKVGGTRHSMRAPDCNNLHLRRFTLIELLLVMVLSAFMVVTAAMFATPISEMFQLTESSAYNVTQSRQALSRVLKELRRPGASPSVVSSTEIRFEAENGDTYTVSRQGNESPYSLQISDGANNETLLDQATAFNVANETVTDGTGATLFQVIRVSLTVNAGENNTKSVQLTSYAAAR